MTAIETEKKNAPEFYALPDGWTWERVAETRARFKISERFFPLASSRGVVAWGRPMPATPDPRPNVILASGLVVAVTWNGSGWQVAPIGSDRALTDAEWDDYCDRLKKA